jgi:hypothetical protein
LLTRRKKMSGGHYDCFYNWDELDEALGHIEQFYAVANDFEKMDMQEAADSVREAAYYLDSLRKAWTEGIVPGLCHHMDWYQSMDTSEDGMRARCSEVLGHRPTSVRIFREIGKVRHDKTQAWVYNQNGVIMRELSGDWDDRKGAILLCADESTIFRRKQEDGWVEFDPRES